MPAKSQAQWRLMQAAAHGHSDKVPPSVAREFIAATQHPGKLPTHSRKKQVGRHKVYRAHP